MIAGVGVAARAPLARVPENTMKFAVGVMLTSFGTFWGAEGAGVAWPGNDAALLAVIPAVALVCLAYTALLRRARAATQASRGDRHPGHPRGGVPMSRWLRSFGAFWYDFVIGDDWRGAAVVVLALALTAVLVHGAASTPGGCCRPAWSPRWAGRCATRCGPVLTGRGASPSG